MYKYAGHGETIPVHVGRKSVTCASYYKISQGSSLVYWNIPSLLYLMTHHWEVNTFSHNIVPLSLASCSYFF